MGDVSCCPFLSSPVVQLHSDFVIAWWEVLGNPGKCTPQEIRFLYPRAISISDNLGGSQAHAGRSLPVAVSAVQVQLLPGGHIDFSAGVISSLMSYYWSEKREGFSHSLQSHRAGSLRWDKVGLSWWTWRSDEVWQMDQPDVSPGSEDCLERWDVEPACSFSHQRALHVSPQIREQS